MVVSSTGHITLPKAVRQKRGWNAGTRLVVEETSEGVLLTDAAWAFEDSEKPKVAEVLARLRKYRGRLPESFKFDRFEANER
ncbi:AbrB/MazE/SpoVT family DNA-binding domain-containing protein [Microvirga arsenatis]|uniref:AbrB/MazE/SpoVT family DNA-binding domain-containing protein n=1 Tax=Microvirga arsenatis TaxID=2692265 RepID=UPI0031BB28F9